MLAQLIYQSLAGYHDIDTGKEMKLCGVYSLTNHGMKGLFRSHYRVNKFQYKGLS